MTTVLTLQTLAASAGIEFCISNVSCESDVSCYSTRSQYTHDFE